MDLSQNKKLKWIEVQGNNLERLDLSALVKLERAYIGENPLTEATFPENSNITELNINGSLLDSLDLHALGKLRHLDATNGNLKGSVDLSTCPYLEHCELDGNPELQTIVLAKDQTITHFRYDSKVVIRYK